MGDSATAAPNPICLTGLAADLWPHTAQLEADGDISVGGLRLSALAGRYGTPAYILDEADVRARCRAYTDAFPGAEIAYAGKAFLCRAMAQWIAQEGLSLDVCSAGELAVARSVRFPADRILLHGNAKTPDDLGAALGYGVGRVVIDSASEIIRLAALSRWRQRVLIRVTPGVDAGLEPVAVAGRYCEAGDVVAVDVPLPADTRPGDLLAVPGTGAYNHSMASNYNMVGRPPVVAVRDGAARLLVRRETDSDLLLRDVGM